MAEKIDPMKIAREGMKKLNAPSSHELASIGNLRAGNTGVVDKNGKSFGRCSRKAHLRMLGLEIEEHDEGTLVMFGGGNISERLWDDWYDAAGQKYLCEQDVPVEWTTKNGKKVTGRPDRVLLDGEGNKIHVLEHKRVSSVFTARSVRIQIKPKIDHLAQLGHYMWKLNLPGTLTYTQDVIFHLSLKGFNQQYAIAKWVKDAMPHEAIDESGWTPVVRSYIYGYRCHFDDKGTLWYQGETEDKPSKTVITIDGIERYFDIASAESLGPVPKNTNPDGKGGYSPCDYCPLFDVCKTVKTKNLTYQDWLMLVKARPETKPVNLGESDELQISNV